MGDSILAAALEAAKREAELQAKADATPERVQAEVSFAGRGPSWAARVWARLTAKPDQKPDYAAGVDVSKRWD